MGFDDDLTRLATLSPAGLRQEWQDRLDEAAPDLPTSLLRRALAYDVQVRVHGGLPPATLRMLGVAGGPEQKSESPIQLKPGTRLLREWNGTVHAVLVTEGGFLFDDRRYASLSQIAKAITGAHWSGPRFFGLRRRMDPPMQRSHAHG